jgi:flagellin
MALSINTNIQSLLAQQALKVNNPELRERIAKLSSGLRVNSAADDAAGLSRADQLRSQTMAIHAAMRNANDGLSAIEVADQGAAGVSDILTRMNELAVSAAQGTLDDQTRGYYNNEFNALRDELQRITNTTQFGGTNLLDGSAAAIGLQVGTTGSAESQMNVPLADFSLSGLNPGGGPTLAAGIGTQALATQAIDTIQTALKNVNDARAAFGATSNRLTGAIENLGTIDVNTQAAESRIRDADFAFETAQLTRSLILNQANIATLGQANMSPQSALKLLGA